MLLSIDKVNFSQQSYPMNSERIYYYFDDNKIEKISIPTQQNDSFEKIDNSRIDEMGMVTISSSVLGAGIGYWVASGQNFFTKLIATSLGALIGLGTSAYYFAKKMVNENKIN